MLQNEYHKIQSLGDLASISHDISIQCFFFFGNTEELHAFTLNALQFCQYIKEKLIELYPVIITHFPFLNFFEFNKLNFLHCIMIALLIQFYCRNHTSFKTLVLRQANQLNTAKDNWILRSQLKKEKIKNRRLKKRNAVQEEIIQKLQTAANLQMTNLSEKIKDETQTIRSTIHTKQQMLNESEIQKSRQLTMIHKLENQITKLNDKIDLLVGQKQDLKNIISSLSTANTQSEQIRLDTMQGRRIIVVGGHPRWIAKLRLTCPDFVYIGADKLNFDYSILKNAEQIAICYLYMNHALYRKTIEYARKKHIPVGYVKCISDVLYFFK